MRIGVIFQRFGPYHFARVGGLARVGAVATGIELSAVDRTYAWAPCEAGPDIRLITAFRAQHTADLGFARLYRGIACALDEAGVDCVAIPGWASAGSLAALLWCRRNGVPAVLMSASTADDEPRVKWKEAVKRRVVSQCSAALVGGAPHVEYAAALGMARERIFTGYDVVDNEHFAVGAARARAGADALRAALALPARYFFASNRFIEKKNLPRLLGAFARYRREAGGCAWDLVLLGDGPLRPALERQIRGAGLEDSVHMPGFKQYDELPAYYGLAGAFVHASTTEQWGLVVNEAMAAGLPVIVSERCGCAPDLVANGENGFTFDPYDEDALAQRLLRVAGEDCDRAAMGEASRRIIARWTPQTFAEGLLQAAEAALAAPRRRLGALDRGLLWALARR